MWPGLVQTAKEAGVNTIETYVFWNGHEPSPGNVSAKPVIFGFLLIQWDLNLFILNISKWNVTQFFLCGSIILGEDMILSSLWRLFRRQDCIWFFELGHLLQQSGILGKNKIVIQIAINSQFKNKKRRVVIGSLMNKFVAS